MRDDGVAGGVVPDGRAAGGERRWAWPLTVAANLCLGVVGLVPFFLLVLFLINFPLAALGLTSREPTENDGMFPWAVVLTPLLLGFCALWFLANLGLRNLTPAEHARRHWWLAALLTSAPALSLPVGALVSGSF